MTCVRHAAVVMAAVAMVFFGPAIWGPGIEQFDKTWIHWALGCRIITRKVRIGAMRRPYKGDYGEASQLCRDQPVTSKRSR
jgi:hypothetical protein